MRILLGFVFGFGTAVGGLLLMLWVQDQHSVHKVNEQSDMAQCFGTRRDGVMSARERELFAGLESACARFDLAAIDQIVYFPSEAVTIGCSPTSAVFLEPALPSVSLTVVNISASELAVLEPMWIEESEAIRLTPRTGTPTWIVQPNPDARYIRRIGPGESYTFSHELNLPAYGIHQVTIAFGAWRMTSRSQHGYSLVRQWAQRTQCQVEWLAGA